MIHSKRDYQFDTIKGVMVFFVVVLHAIASFYTNWDENLFLSYPRFFMMTSTMPVLIFISGYFSKRKGDYETYIIKALKRCLIPFLVFNFIYGLPSIEALNFFSARWTLWYLISLFWWKLIVEAAIKIRFSLLIALLITLIEGLFPLSMNLSLSRTIGYFPFFLAGYLCDSEGIRRMREAKKVFTLAAFLIALVIVGVFIKVGAHSFNPYFTKSYEEMGQSLLQGIMLRIAVLIVGFLFIFVFFSIIPARKSIFTTFGMYSIVIYLGHSAILKVLSSLNIINISSPYVLFGFTLLFALALCFALGNRKVSQLYQTVMEKICALILVK